MSESALFTAAETDWPNDLQGNNCRLSLQVIVNPQGAVSKGAARRRQASQERRENEGLPVAHWQRP